MTLQPAYAVQRGQAYRFYVGGVTTSVPTEGYFTLSYTIDPDREPDGLYDSSDACPTEAGLAEDQGCPDGDDDHIIDRVDQCKATKGERPL